MIPRGHKPCDEEFGCGPYVPQNPAPAPPPTTPSNGGTGDNDDHPTQLEDDLASDADDTPITDFINQLAGSSEDWNNLATGLDILAWLTDLYAAGAVTYAGFAGAALPAPLIAAGLPEVPLATGLAGMAIAELYVQPILFTGNAIATFSMTATIIADTKSGGTIVEESQFSSSSLNSMALTDVGWLSNEAYFSLTIQSISVANDLQWTSLPYAEFP